MLREIYIENLAVIEKAVIPIENGFSVFTGETGAGKSILINGINAVLGQRVTKDLVRTGCKKAVISAMFKVNNKIMNKLSEIGVECEDMELLISREIFSDGGSVARINSRTVNVSLLREIGAFLVNIHGQHDNQILLSQDKHIQILDDFGSMENDIINYQTDFKELQKISRDIKQLSLSNDKKNERINELREVILEIDGMNITDDEDTLIEDEFQMLKNSAELRQVVFDVTTLLTGDDDSCGAEIALLNCEKNLLISSELHKQFGELAERLNQAAIEISDISSELTNIVDSLDLNPSRFDYISERREDLRKIMKKYGPDLKDVMNYLEESELELEQLENNDINISSLIEKRQLLLKKVSKEAKDLSNKRKLVSEVFSKEVCSELEFLNMPNVKFEVQQIDGKLTVLGMDSIEFLISANIGEKPKPIAKIASGGELSRIMLALKNVISEKDDIPTLIFDEIDTGVSGRAAQKIGFKLREISKHRQVLCVTHLAQIAIMGDSHHLIEKKTSDTRTITQVKTLSSDERKYEIARIMGGDNITDLLLKNADEMLKSVN